MGDWFWLGGDIVVGVGCLCCVVGCDCEGFW